VRGLTPLSAWTAGLAGERDPAQPLLTLHDGPARVELSGATAANWVAKSANLLVDGYGGPHRVGLLLPLHWQAVCLLLAGVAAGATVVVAEEPAQLGGCELAFTTAETAEATLDAGVEDVLALSGHPLGAPCSALPPLVADYAREVPSYGDGWSGRADAARIELAGQPLPPLPSYGLTTADRVAFAGPVGPELLGVLHEGAALVLLPAPGGLNLERVLVDEQVTAAFGVTSTRARSLT
jgi:uncharacterized protein (TIGR03089 family)